MAESTQIFLPALIVVTGQPGSGKTTLAHLLAREIRCPAICRDEIQEGSVNTTGQRGQPGDENQRRVYETFFDTLHLLLSRGITLVAEAAFQHKNWAPRLEPLREIARIRIIVCTVDPEVARSRHLARSESDPVREQFHHDRAHQDSNPGPYDPPHLDVPTLFVDTSEEYQPDLQKVVAFARGSIEKPAS